MYSENDWRSYTELYHYGILGQKWGVRNGPPYPLSSSVRKRMNYKNTQGIDEYTPFTKQDAIAYRKAHPIEKLSEISRLEPGTNIQRIRRGINHPVDEDDAGRHYNCPNCAVAFEMTERGYDVIARPKPNGSNAENVETFFKNGRLKGVGIDDYGPEVYAKWDQIAKEQHRASFKDGDPLHDKLFSEYNEICDKYAERARENVVSAIESQGDGARGILVVGWRMRYNPNEDARTTFFHAQNYKNENGKIVFYDTQGRKLSTGYTDTSWLAKECDPRDIYLMRTDQLELSNNVGKAVVSRR